jgi:hypothetical protein
VLVVVEVGGSVVVEVLVDVVVGGSVVVEVVLLVDVVVDVEVDVLVVEVDVDVDVDVVEVVEVVVVVGHGVSSWNTPVVDGGQEPAPLLFAVILLKSKIVSTQTAVLVVPS